MVNEVENQVLLIPSDCYSIDTSVFLDIWCPAEAGMFSREKLPELWSHIEKLVDDGKILASKEVFDELESNASSDLQDWLKKHKSMFVFDKEQVAKAEGLINGFYNQYKRGYKPEIGDAADPFVVATAMAHGAVVFTQEHTQPHHTPSEVNTPKIPTVCTQYGVECVNIEKFIEREGFRISMTQGVDTQSVPVPMPVTQVLENRSLD